MENVKVGDIIVHTDGDEAKVIEVLTNSFLRSSWDYFKQSGDWHTFTEVEGWGWKIKGSEEDTIIIVGGKKYKLIEE